MSIATQIARIQTARNDIRAKLISMGLVDSTADIEDCATAVEGITEQPSPDVEIKEGVSYSISPGYYKGGTITAITDVEGDKERYKLYNYQTVNPQKGKVTPLAIPNGYYGLTGLTVGAIPDNYNDTSSVTATAGNVLANKMFVTQDGELTAGTMPNNGAVIGQLTPSSTQYVIPAGYHNGSGSVGAILEDTLGVTPTTEEQTISPGTGKFLSKVIVQPIPSKFADTSSVTATADNVLDGKMVAIPKKDTDGKVIGHEIVEGTMANNGAASSILTTTSTSYNIPAGYHNGSGTVGITLETKTATPNRTTQSITPTTGKVLSKVTVNPIPADYVTTSDATATAAQILTGKTAYVNGVKVTGTMANQSGRTYTIDGLTTTQATIEEGYYSGGLLKLTDDIETTLAAI